MRRPSAVLLEAARALPDTATGMACAGTALESTTVTVRSKAFLFVSKKEARLKLGASLKEARALAAEAPDRWRVGAGGWARIALAGPGRWPLAMLDRWVRESYSLFAGPARRT